MTVHHRIAWLASLAPRVVACLLAGTIASVGPSWAQGQAAGPGGQRPAQSPAAAATTGTGIITGIISAGDTGRPLRRVRVTLTNSVTNANLGTAVTDAEGRFSFTRLPAGSLTLRAVRTGYLDIVFGQKKLGSGRPGTAIQLAEGQKIENVALQMPRGGVISGMVVDEVGDPALGVPVRAFRYVMRNGVRELTATSNSGATDDRGQYRIPGLVPGEYIVCAAPRDELVMASALYDEMSARMADIRASQAGRGTADVRDVLGPKPDDPRDAYVTMCFPGTTRMADATSVTLDVGEERSGQNIQLQLVPIARVAGKVVWSDGTLPTAGPKGGTTADTQVHLVDRASPNSPGGPRVIHVKADGSFSFTNVQPGQYSLEAHADVPMAEPCASTRAAADNDAAVGQSGDHRCGPVDRRRDALDGARHERVGARRRGRGRARGFVQAARHRAPGWADVWRVQYSRREGRD